jgi:hypothetical protein
VAKVNSDLITRDTEGKPLTVSYDAINAMLLNEFIKEHRTVQELKSIVGKIRGQHRSTHSYCGAATTRFCGPPQTAGSENPEGKRSDWTRQA